MVRKLDGFGKAEGFDVDAYRRRLRILREIVSGDNQTDFAKRLGVDYKRWSNYERGYPVPREVAFLLHERFPGMSIEWIWFNKYTGLSTDYRDRILLAEKLDLEREQHLAELEKIQSKLNAADEKRKKALHPTKPKARQK